MKISTQALTLFERLSDASPTSAPSPRVHQASASPQKVVSRLEITKEGVCPYCSRPMRRTFAANVGVWLCDSDRHVAPVKNGDELTL